MKLFKRKMRVGDIVMTVDCRGCMAEDHQFVHVAMVESFEYRKIHGSWLSQDKIAIMAILKDGTSGDCRDRPMGTQDEVVGNGQLQHIAGNFWVRYK